MRYSIIALLFFGFVTGRVAAGQIKEIALNDGSVIFGEVIALEEDIFIIKTVGLGTVQVEKSKIRTMRQKPNAETTGEQISFDLRVNEYRPFFLSASKGRMNAGYLKPKCPLFSLEVRVPWDVNMLSSTTLSRWQCFFG